MTKNHLKIGIIGCGNIGVKRAKVILELGKDRILGVYDIDKKKTEALAEFANCQAYLSAEKILTDKTIDSLIIATTTDVNVVLTEKALKAKKHVLAEKPLGKNHQTAEKLWQLSQKCDKILKVGFNHRHHPAVMKANRFAKQGAIGKIFYIKSVYGHGGRPGYDLDWRMRKKTSAGGELFDQGVHIIDLANWFVGNFVTVFANTRNYFWKKSPFEDNAFCQLVSGLGQTVDFQVSITQWKNKFLFEIFGSKGYLIIDGLGKSYGVEKLTLGTSVGKGKVPKEKIWQFEGKDISWQEEWKEFRSAVFNHRQPLASGKDNVTVMKILDGLYKSAKTNKIIKL